MARALELKRMLTNIKKSEGQSMDAYLREIKSIADNLASVDSPVPLHDLVHYTLMGLGHEYETLVTTLTHVPMQLCFDDLRPRLLLQEQRLKFLDGDDTSVHHPALVTHQASNSSFSAQNRSQNQSGRNNHSNRGGGSGRGNNRNNNRSNNRGGGQRNNNNNNRGGGGYRHNNNNSSYTQSPRSVPTDMSIGISSQLGVLGTAPTNRVCQICSTPGHSALQCPRFLLSPKFHHHRTQFHLLHL